MKEYQAELFLDIGCTLGEGPMWDDRRQRLWFVEIDEKRLYSVREDGEDLQRYSMPDKPSLVVPMESGDLALGLPDGIWRFSPETGELKRLALLNEDPAIRFNDGKAGPAGELWAGTIGRGAKLFRLPGEGEPEIVLESVSISNGIAFSPDRKIMYYVDTPTRRVDAFDYDAVRGTVSNRRPCVEDSATPGSPDGMTVDTHGNLWPARWGGFGVYCYRPFTNTPIAVVRTTVECTSCPVFGGGDYRTMFITTANQSRSGKPQSHPGGLFKVRLEVGGKAPFRWRR